MCEIDNPSINENGIFSTECNAFSEALNNYIADIKKKLDSNYWNKTDAVDWHLWYLRLETLKSMFIEIESEYA